MRHHTGDIEGLRTLMFDELEAIAGGDAEDGDTEEVIVVTGYEGDPSANLWFKSVTNPSVLTTNITSIFNLLVEKWAQHGTGVTPVITATNNGSHDPNSHHYTGNAIDLRGNNISDSTGQAIAAELQSILGPSYFVDFEIFPNDPTNDHLHIEYDPN